MIYNEYMGKDCKYILKGTKPVVEPDPIKWAKWLETGNRKVAFDTAPNDVRISTTFLGIDHSFGRNKQPILFETLVFKFEKSEEGSFVELDGRRYSTWKEAKRGHEMFVMKYNREKAEDAEIIEENKK
jgi:hypothetical protein